MGDRVVVTIACQTCKDRNYGFVRGRKQERKLEISKFCPKCGKHTPHKEIKSST